MTAKSTTLEVGQRVRIEVTPAPVESASGLSQINQNDRNCWMSNEVVTMEGLYNFQTCVTICRALAIYEKCGCIPFYYPPFGYGMYVFKFCITFVLYIKMVYLILMYVHMYL